MLDKVLEQTIIATVREAAQAVMLSYNEEWVTESELRKKIQMFTTNFMRDNAKYLPQKSAIYEDKNGVHETRIVYGLHAIQRMILNDDLDFTRPDRVVYRKSKGRKAGNERRTTDMLQ